MKDKTIFRFSFSYLERVKIEQTLTSIIFYSILDDNDSRNSSSILSRQQESSTNRINDKENIVQISLLVKQEPSTPRRRSRFDQDSTVSDTDPPVIIRKFYSNEKFFFFKSFC